MNLNDVNDQINIVTLPALVKLSQHLEHLLENVYLY